MSDTADKTSIVASDTFKGKIRAADDAPPSIVLLVGPPGHAGKQWLLKKSDMTIGRADGVEISIPDSSLSRSHAKIIVTPTDVQIVDLGSTNKTFVNELPLPPMVPRRLTDNNKIKTGNVIFKFLEKGNLESLATQELYDKSEKDALTGAFNKGALLLKGPEAIKRSTVLGEPLSVITFDIDFFKKINDACGHPGGDYVLKELGHLMNSKLVRSNDYFSRYGGEEFVLILQATPMKTAMEVAERIRATVESHQFIFEGRRIPVTISIGVSAKIVTDTWESVYERADKALYSSKQNGRNRITQAS